MRDRGGRVHYAEDEVLRGDLQHVVNEFEMAFERMGRVLMLVRVK